MTIALRTSGRRPWRWHRAIAAGLAFCSSLASSQLAAPLDNVAWLTGCWAADGGEPGSVEHWLAPAGGSMFGVSRSVRAGRLSQFEFMTIRTLPDGRLVFVALPGGKNSTEFTSASLTAGEVVFENAKHDFPNRVIYRRIGEKTMLGRIEGVANGQPRAVDFPFTRTACAEFAKP
jgi:hypothetical protein